MQTNDEDINYDSQGYLSDGCGQKYGVVDNCQPAKRDDASDSSEFEEIDDSGWDGCGQKYDNSCAWFERPKPKSRGPPKNMSKSETPARRKRPELTSKSGTKPKLTPPEEIPQSESEPMPTQPEPSFESFFESQDVAPEIDPSARRCFESLLKKPCNLLKSELRPVGLKPQQVHKYPNVMKLMESTGEGLYMRKYDGWSVTVDLDVHGFSMKTRFNQHDLHIMKEHFKPALLPQGVTSMRFCAELVALVDDTKQFHSPSELPEAGYHGVSLMLKTKTREDWARFYLCPFALCYVNNHNCAMLRKDDELDLLRLLTEHMARVIPPQYERISVKEGMVLGNKLNYKDFHTYLLDSTGDKEGFVLCVISKEHKEPLKDSFGKLRDPYSVKIKRAVKMTVEAKLYDKEHVQFMALYCLRTLETGQCMVSMMKLEDAKNIGIKDEGRYEISPTSILRFNNAKNPCRNYPKMKESYEVLGIKRVLTWNATSILSCIHVTFLSDPHFVSTYEVYRRWYEKGSDENSLVKFRKARAAHVKSWNEKVGKAEAELREQRQAVQVRIENEKKEKRLAAFEAMKKREDVADDAPIPDDRLATVCVYDVGMGFASLAKWREALTKYPHVLHVKNPQRDLNYIVVSSKLSVAQFNELKEQTDAIPVIGSWVDSEGAPIPAPDAMLACDKLENAKIFKGMVQSKPKMRPGIALCTKSMPYTIFFRVEKEIKDLHHVQFVGDIDKLTSMALVDYIVVSQKIKPEECNELLLLKIPVVLCEWVNNGAKIPVDDRYIIKAVPEPVARPIAGPVSRSTTKRHKGAEYKKSIPKKDDTQVMSEPTPAPIPKVLANVNILGLCMQMEEYSDLKASINAREYLTLVTDIDELSSDKYNVAVISTVLNARGIRMFREETTRIIVSTKWVDAGCPIPVPLDFVL